MQRLSMLSITSTLPPLIRTWKMQGSRTSSVPGLPIRQLPAPMAASSTWVERSPSKKGKNSNLDPAGASRRVFIWKAEKSIRLRKRSRSQRQHHGKAFQDVAWFRMLQRAKKGRAQQHKTDQDHAISPELPSLPSAEGCHEEEEVQARQKQRPCAFLGLLEFPPSRANRKKFRPGAQPHVCGPQERQPHVIAEWVMHHALVRQPLKPLVEVLIDRELKVVVGNEFIGLIVFLT